MIIYDFIPINISFFWLYKMISLLMWVNIPQITIFMGDL